MDLTNLENKLVEVSEYVAERYKQSLNSGDINASYELFNSISVEVIKETNKLTASISLLDYWKWIENGRTPGKFPNLTALINWVKVKNLPIKGKIKTPEQIAYVIGRHIQRNGIKAKPILAEANDTEKFADEIAEAFALDVEQHITKMII